jgi:hypothetical protein
MKRFLRHGGILAILLAVAAAGFAQGKGALKCVGLYSETSEGQVSYRVGGGAWVVMKVGDIIPANAEVRVNVDRDWVELTASGNPNAVYEIDGPDQGEIVKKVPDILKGKPRVVSFPRPASGAPDPRFKNKLVVTQYLGRHVYTTAGGDENDIKYGDVLPSGGKIRIIAINATVNLEDASGKMVQVVGPLDFTVDQVLKGEKLYKYLNVPR